ncbi:g-D-glutamyl-meso-diaminopimelate peptidase [Parageobacillus thermantarcticus]|uniref:G-D-glutamyl-meso-diaminopimelate peptidase n=1 Tax=Parageobacillus thermantarcticus TaxID=186116 RepID=A0A1I0SEW6_9BACL|nr:g-D-glutamyl-meso-diaminopimelate peptidase [Parageobacillus thermantarcticus]
MNRFFVSFSASRAHMLKVEHQEGEDALDIYASRGDALTAYSEWFSVPYELLRDSNPHIKKDRLEQGEVVRIPGYETVCMWEELEHFFFVHKEALRRMKGTEQIVRGSVQLPKRVISRVIQGQKAYDFFALKQDIEALCRCYPFMRTRAVGYSVLGLPLIEIQIGQGPIRVHLNGSFHANEWITSAIIMTFLNDYLLAVTNGKTLRGHHMLDYYQKVTLSAVPMVNPDGVNLVLHGPPRQEPHRSEVVRMNGGSADFSQWKANIRGVDLNNQFPAKWEVERARKIPKAPAPRDFPGFAPLTEPEAKAMAALTEESDFDMIVAFHTQGKEIYWGYEGLEPPCAEKTAMEFAKTSGYQAVKYIDSHAGYRDWFIQTWKRRGYTVELGEGVNPLPMEQFTEIYEDSLGIFLAALYMA